MSPDYDGSVGVCNGVYTVIGERKGCTVLHCSISDTFCFRVNVHDFEHEYDWEWCFTMDDPRQHLLSNEYGEIINERGDWCVPNSRIHKVSDEWPIGVHTWNAYVDGDIVDCQCTMTLLWAADVERLEKAKLAELREGARQSVDGVGAITVSGFVAHVGAPSLCALRLNGCYEREPDRDDGCPHFRNEWGHHFYFTQAVDDLGPGCFWGFDEAHEFERRGVNGGMMGAAWSVFPSFSAIFNRKMQELPLLSCILLRNEGKTGQESSVNHRWAQLDSA